MCRCEFCNKEFATESGLKGHYGGCKVKRELLINTLTKEKLYDLMYVKNFSANYIGTIWMVQETGHIYYPESIIRLAKQYGFKTRNVKEANANPERQKLYKKYVREKYGVDNVSQIKEIKQAKENTFMEHYGMKNIFHNKEYIREKTFKKYGVYNAAQIPNRNNSQNNGYISKVHKKIESILDELGVKYISDTTLSFNKFNEELQKDYNPRPDILIEDKKIIIEIQGDHWHLNPRFFKPNDEITWLWEGDCIAQDVWNHDNIRKRHLESFGYKVYFLWEYDIRHDIVNVKNQIIKWLQ